MALSVYVMMMSNRYNSPPKSVFSSEGIITLYALKWLALEVHAIAVAIQICLAHKFHITSLVRAGVLLLANRVVCIQMCLEVIAPLKQLVAEMARVLRILQSCATSP